ncbi:uncharacterized protein LOC126368229 [Pectinophora gossypiella]|uniref:Transmembrane protein 126A n=1 Tax=Pectinophora gossypiella TaxID=13191 RepID=A0A1E1W564_PECGO|nr:uncharacterized protein LOC126368229 [Pectinophora gossypiella]
MALMRSSKEVPEDAVILDELEATSYMWDLVTDWANPKDTWALRYAPGVLGGISAVSGLLINNHYRTKLKLGTYGYMSSVIPISVMPALMTALFHRHVISTGMLLMKNEACPICYEVKSAAIQLALGVGYPLVLGPASALMFASRYGTYRVPNLAEGPKVMFQFLRKMTKPLSGTLAFLTVTHFVASSVLTYFEMRNNFAVRRKMIEIENRIIAEQGEEN